MNRKCRPWHRDDMDIGTREGGNLGERTGKRGAMRGRQSDHQSQWVLRRALVLIALPVRLPGTPIRLNEMNHCVDFGESGCQAPPRDGDSGEGTACH